MTDETFVYQSIINEFSIDPHVNVELNFSRVVVVCHSISTCQAYLEILLGQMQIEQLKGFGDPLFPSIEIVSVLTIVWTNKSERVNLLTFIFCISYSLLICYDCVLYSYLENQDHG